MKKSFYLSLILIVIFQTATPVWAEAINSRKNLESAEKLMAKIGNYLDEALVDEAEEAWEKANDFIQETYNDKKKMKPPAAEEIAKQRSALESQLEKYRKMIDIARIQLIIRSGNPEDSMEYLETLLNSDAYEGQNPYYIGNIYYQTGLSFMDAKDYANTRACFSKASGYFEKASKEQKETEERRLAKIKLGELQNSLFNLYLLQGKYEEANEVLASILKAEGADPSEDPDRYMDLKEIQEAFPLHVLSEISKSQSPGKAFEQFCQLLEGEYGKNLTVSERSRYFGQAASFFEKNSQPQLAAECEKRQLEMYVTGLREKTFSLPDRQKILEEYEELLNNILAKAEQARDYKTVFMLKKNALDLYKEEFGKSDPRVLQACLESMDYFFDLGDKKNARFFFEKFSQIREQAKEEEASSRDNYAPLSFFLNELSDFALYSNDEDDVLYEPTRQRLEARHRITFAPQGNVEKEFRFWDLYHQFLQNPQDAGEERSDLAENLFDLIQDPVFQQFEYARPILRLGTYYHQNQKFRQAAFCADLSGDIVSFFAAPDSPENFFPILLGAAVLMDSGSPEMASAEVQHLLNFGVLQRMGRLASMNENGDDSILKAWPFGELNPTMSTKSLGLAKSAETIPDPLLEEKIECYQPGTNPIPIVIKFANQYEKAGQYTQARLLYQFAEPFYQDLPESQEALREKIDLLEEKSK